MNKTHFGYREVPITEKENLVRDVFQSVANKYDIMNDLMSLGLHRVWKKCAIAEANVRNGQMILDVAAGTGDLTKAFAKLIGKSGKIFMTDINETMLAEGRDRLLNSGLIENIFYVQANAEHLPFAENYFDCITIAFGLRNVTDKSTALRDMWRVLKPGGKLIILEFSHPVSDLFSKIYDAYSFNIIPKIGEWVADDRESYQYLVESIRMHPNQETLKTMMLAAGYEDVTYLNLSGGIVALHKGFKY